MNYSRRDFIKKSTGAGITAGLIPIFLNKVSGQSKIHGFFDSFKMQPVSQSFGDFQRLLATDFTIYTEEFAFTAVLQEVRASNFTSARSTGECFSLEFHANGVPSTSQFLQRTYTLYHPEIGKFELFLVPAQGEKEGLSLIAVINRI